MRTVLFSIILLAESSVFSQILPIEVRPEGSGNWIYINIKGEAINEYDYELTYPYSDEGITLAGYPTLNSFAILNRNGIEIKRLLNCYVSNVMGVENAGYASGLIIIKRKESLWGCMDSLGNIVIETKYDFISPFNDGFATARLKEKFFVLNSNGEETLLIENDVCDVRQFSEGLAAFRINKKLFKSYLCGFIDTAGNTAIQPEFLSVGEFSNGLAWARGKNKLYGYINKTGTWVIKPVFTKTGNFDKESGLAKVKKGEKWTFINETGEVISFKSKDFIDDFSEGMARAKDSYLFGFMNSKGEWVIKPQFEGARKFRNGYAAAKMNDLWGVIDRSGNWVVKPVYAGIKDVHVLKN